MTNNNNNELNVENKDDNEEVCVFVRFRDEIKFEDFSGNHPSVYLPFVCQHFLVSALLPTVYDNDNPENGRNLEKSRVELLQKERLILKLINVFVNTILTVDVKMSEKIFDDAVSDLKLKSKKNHKEQITKDDIYTYLFCEHYLSDSDKRVYLSALSRHLPPPVAYSKSSELVPSAQYYRLYSDVIPQGQEFWGPPYWLCTHLATYTVDTYGDGFMATDYRHSLAGLSGFFDLILPCGVCRHHYGSYDSVDAAAASQLEFPEEEIVNFYRPFPVTLPYLALTYASQKRLFDFYSYLHGLCKPNDGATKNREPLGVDFYRNIFRKWST